MSTTTDEDHSIDEDLEDEDDEQGWNDWESQEGDNEARTKSLFSDTFSPSPAASMDYDAATYGFDLRHYAVQEKLDTLSTIKCINFIRGEVAAGKGFESVLPALMEAAGKNPKPWNDDRFMMPIDPEDGLLQYDFEDSLEDVVDTQVEVGRMPAEVSRLKAENDALRTALTYLSSSVLPDDVLELINSTASLQLEGSESGPSGSQNHPVRESANEAGPGPSSLTGRKRKSRIPGLSASETARVDESYFDSYSYLGIHREMLDDKVRTESYRRALEGNPALLKGATVLDVGCGTGILSMFAARAGAAQVIGVDGSEAIAEFARKVVAANQLGAEQGGPITILAGKVEELTEVPFEKVDVIVSEWMGYGLLFESMLDTVLFARDKWLKPGGAVLPDTATLHLAGGAAGCTGLDFWSDVYGFTMAPIGDTLREGLLRRAHVGQMKPDDIITNTALLKQLDIAAMSAADADFHAEFELWPKSEGSGEESAAGSVDCCSLVLWFDTDFSTRVCPQEPVKLSTSPHGPATHWAQTVLTLRQPVTLRTGPASKASADANVAIRGRISFARGNVHRNLDISVEYSAVRADGSTTAIATDIYSLGMGED